MHRSAVRGMAKYKVVLHGRNVLMSDGETGKTQRAGFLVTCCVEAGDPESAGSTALDILRRNHRYGLLDSWPPGRSGRPEVEVESVDEVRSLTRRVALGVTAGFAFYVDEDQDGK
jgi:hypothetical protein